LTIKKRSSSVYPCLKVWSGAATSECDLVISLSQAFRLIIAPDVTSDAEDWRFFESKRDATHFIVEGGKIDPLSLP
jgi:hypothetical protein